MQTEEKRVRVLVHFGGNGTAYGCGHSLDTLLYAHKLTTENDTFEWTEDRRREAMNWELGRYDFEGHTLARLNDAKASDMLGEILERKIPAGLLVASEIEASEYLPGDWLRFNRPEAFGSLVLADRARIMEAVQDNLGDWERPSIPADLAKALKRSCDGAEEEAQHEWLHGDRSTPGVLVELARAMFGRHSNASVEWAACTDTVAIEATADDWREWMGYDLDERDPLPAPEALAEEVKGTAIKKAGEVRAERARKTEGRVAESRRREELRAEALEREQEAAKERKRKRNQA